MIACWQDGWGKYEIPGRIRMGMRDGFGVGGVKREIDMEFCIMACIVLYSTGIVFELFDYRSGEA